MIPPLQLVPKLKQLIELDVPIMLGGSPGHAKTSLGYQLAEAAKARTELVHPTVQDPTDVKGLPWVHAGEANFIPLGTMRKLVDPKLPLTIVILDDFGHAPGAMQAAWQHPILARQIEGHIISPNVRWFITTNRRQDRAGANNLLSTIVNRGVYVECAVDADSHADWLLRNGFPPVLAAFERFQPEFLTQEPGKDNKPFSSPRSLALLGRMVMADIHDVRIWEGAVGPACATAFHTFLNDWEKMPDVDKIIAKPTKGTVPKEASVLYALAGALASRATKENLGSIITYVRRLSPEFMVMCLKDTLSQRPELVKAPAFVELASEREFQELFGI